MRSCKSYSPPQAYLLHDGVERNKEYKFNKSLAVPVCTNPAMQPGDGSFATCGYSDAFHECHAYDVESETPLLKFDVEREGGIDTYVLSTFLEDWNMRVYRVSQNNETCFESKVHTNSNAEKDAREYLHKIAEEAQVEVQNMSTKQSYLKRVLQA